MKAGKLMVSQIPYTMPPSDPAYCKPPFWYRDVEAIQVGFETDYESVADLVPAPLELDDVPTGVCMFSNIPFSTLGKYLECIVMFSVTFNGRRYLYLPTLFVDQEIPMLAGREIWGYAKKLAKMEVIHDKNHITFTCERPEGTRLITATVTPQTNQPFEFYQNTDIISLKIIPNAEKDQIDIAQLVGCSYHLTPIKGTDGIAELWTGIGSVTFGCCHSNDDALYRIPVNKVVSALYGKFQIYLPYGYILHDYLKAK
jgi:acetoacetate decarboxylase